ncbi:MAG: DUF11 domain-containing protein [Actinobacteria bacterium]|nr:DUF11 domain-containing protein [Actinomycetota bacterium]
MEPATAPGFRCDRAWVAALGIVALLSLALAAPADAGPARAAAGARALRAGIPQAPQVLYSEDFENGMGRSPVLLTSYQGVPPLLMTYGAHQRFLQNCNGFIVQFESNERVAKTDCAEVAFNRVRQMAWVLGKLRGTEPLANHAVSAYTDGKATLPENAVQFETLKPIPVDANGRFITFSVDATETNCGKNHAEFKFYLVEGATEIPTFTSPIDPCSAVNAEVIEPPTLGTKAEPFKAGTFAGNAATLFSGTSLGIRMRNGQISETGNDAAFDNIEVLDATPQLDKSFSPEINNVGGVSQLTYTITNTSELAAKEGWSFTDTLPEGLVVATPAMGSTTCAEPTTIGAGAGGGTVTVKGTLAAEMSYCTVAVNVTSAKEARYVNGPDNVTETGIEPPGEAPVEFGDNADLAIGKSVSPTPGRPGGEATFTLQVTNNGPDTAKEVVVSDPVPAGLEFVSAEAPCAEADGEVTCPLGSLANGDSRSLEFVVRIPREAEEGFVNTATVGSPTPDPDLSNNSATVPLPLQPEADLAITKLARPPHLTAGGHVTYVLSVHNAGPSAATSVTVTDPPARVIHLLTARPSQGSCDLAHGLICGLGRIAAGGNATILVTAQVAPSAKGTIPNTARVVGGEVDPNPEDNSATAKIVVDPLTPKPLPPAGGAPELGPARPQAIADLAVAKRVDRTTARVGQTVTYTLHVTNQGPDEAIDAHLIDGWSHRLKIVSVHPSRGRCGDGVPLECGLGTMRRGVSATIVIKAMVLEPGRLRNTATVTADSRDPNVGNNQSAAETVVRARPTPPPPPVVTG